MKKKIDYVKIGKLCAKGLTLKYAMEAGGFSRSSARRGKDSMSEEGEMIFTSTRDKAAMKKLGKFIDLGKQVTADQQEHLIRGGLLANVAEGKDNAAQSLKLLGQDRRVNMFTPENSSGVIIIQAAHIPSFPENSTHNITEKLGCGCYGICHCGKSALPQSAVEAR